jgi:hypothetical protein
VAAFGESDAERGLQPSGLAIADRKTGNHPSLWANIVAPNVSPPGQLHNRTTDFQPQAINEETVNDFRLGERRGLLRRLHPALCF